ncbi:DUF2785 domain-containing protein [Flindersiella endophytica]
MTTKTDWAAVVAADFIPPEGREARELVDELVEALRSADPVLRDQQAFMVLATWIRRGLFDKDLAALGDRMAETLSHQDIQARTFAVLILASAVLRDTRAGAGLLEPERVLRWRDAFAAWYATEEDLRGWDDDLGWLHAVAHGSDFLDELGGSPHLGTTELADLLELAATRLIAPTPYVFAYAEDDRLAAALATVLLRPELSEVEATGWLETIATALRSRDRTTIPPWVSNTVRTLRALYVLADRGVRQHDGEGWAEPRPLPHATAVKERLAHTLAGFEPHTG